MSLRRIDMSGLTVPQLYMLQNLISMYTEVHLLDLFESMPILSGHDLKYYRSQLCEDVFEAQSEFCLTFGLQIEPNFWIIPKVNHYEYDSEMNKVFSMLEQAYYEAKQEMFESIFNHYALSR